MSAHKEGRRLLAQSSGLYDTGQLQTAGLRLHCNMAARPCQTRLAALPHILPLSIMHRETLHEPLDPTCL